MVGRLVVAQEPLKHRGFDSLIADRDKNNGPSSKVWRPETPEHPPRCCSPSFKREDVV